jgi:hypothetical protein
MFTVISVISWIWLVIPAAIGLLAVWVLVLELRQVYRHLRVWIRKWR